ncbi:MAG: LLM class F420-dependent oxidoreductase [Acidimicrobiales bacterium]
MKFGVMFANVFGFSGPREALALAQGAEAAGFESLWTVDHVVVPEGYESPYPYSRSARMPGGEFQPLPDPLTWMAWVAGATGSIRLATGVLVLPQRQPALVAKQVATLDHLSGGRVTLGVGVGWLAEEFDALGMPFARRGRRLDAYIHALRALWSGGPTTLDGRFVSMERAICLPKPVQDPLPIVVGGHSEGAARRAGRLGDGFFPAMGRGFESLLPVMRDAANEAGRDADAVEVTVLGPAAVGPGALDEVERLAGLGVARIVIRPPTTDPRAIGDALAAYGADVIRA